METKGDNSATQIAPALVMSRFAQNMLIVHNRYRKRHFSKPLRASEELCRDAQAWAESLAQEGKVKHASWEARQGDGENLYKIVGRKWRKAKYVTRKWYKERRKYEQGKPGRQPGTSEFTQLVWKSTIEFGAGIAKTKEGAHLVVARYRPAGNLMAEYRENVSRKKSRYQLEVKPG